MGNKSSTDLFNDGKKDATAEQEVDKQNTHDLKSFNRILSPNSATDVGESDDNDVELNVSKMNVPKKLNFRSLVNDDKVDNSDIVLPRAAIEKVKNAYTSSMCSEAWGRINFARALIEVSSDSDLKKEVTMVVPNKDETDYTREVICVKYEWQPPRCVACKKFGHSSDRCPKIIREPITPVSMDINSDGFKEVQRKKIKDKKADLHPMSRQRDGIWLNMPNPYLYWQKMDESGTPSSRGNQEKEREERIKELDEFDEDVDEFIFPEGDKFDIRLKVELGNKFVLVCSHKSVYFLMMWFGWFRIYCLVICNN
ncbi:hypothetical protein Tco_0670630 [Tanacetum coccineum]